MAIRIASIMSLIAFAVCLVVGGIQADNPFTTAVERALVAMMGTMVIGLIVGWMAQKMLDENLRSAEEKLKKMSADPKGDGR
jgi:NhaP-type Na+/H+ or K+/H+ antiporter